MTKFPSLFFFSSSPSTEKSHAHDPGAGNQVGTAARKAEHQSPAFYSPPPPPSFLLLLLLPPLLLSASTTQSLFPFQKHTFVRLRFERRLLLAPAEATSHAAQLCTKCGERVGVRRACSGLPDSDIPGVRCRDGGGGVGKAWGGGGSVGRPVADLNYAEGGRRRGKVVECYRSRRGRYGVILRVGAEEQKWRRKCPIIPSRKWSSGRACMDIRRLVPSCRTGCVERERGEAGRQAGRGREGGREQAGRQRRGGKEVRGGGVGGVSPGEGGGEEGREE